MAFYDDPLADPSLSFDAQEQQLLQQQARIKAMRAAAGVPVEAPAMSPGWTSSVTGAHIGGKTLKTPTAALLSPIINSVGADLQEGRLNRATAALDAAKQADFQKYIDSTPQTVTGAIPTNAPSATNPDGNLVAATPMAPEAPTRQQLIAHAATGMQNPLSRALAAKQIEDLTIAAPTREAAAALAAQNTQWDRTFKLTEAAEKARHNAALEAKPSGQFQDSGQVDARGNKILVNPTAPPGQQYFVADPSNPGGPPTPIPTPPGAPASVAPVTAPVAGGARSNAGAVAQVESAGGRNLFNPISGAKGAMGVLDSTNGNPGYGVTPARDNSPAERERVGGEYLAAMQKRYGENSGYVAYNMGPGNYEKWKAAGGIWSQLPKETQEYVGKVNLAKEGHAIYEGAGTAVAPAAAAPGVALDKNGKPIVGAKPAPVKMDATENKALTASVVKSAKIDALEKMYDPDTMSGTRAFVGTIPGPGGQPIGSTKYAGDQDKRSAQFYESMRGLTNDTLRALSGMAVTSGEEARHNFTIPGPLTDPALTKAWFSFSRKVNDLESATSAALTQPGARATREGVIDKQGNIVPGTVPPKDLFSEIDAAGKATAAPAQASPGKWKIEKVQ